ncbi:MAG: hypothetical protein GY751_15390 [Bacteroidetes bacterium]|nr:hypothetical protein [Bacteroidota bacterium]
MKRKIWLFILISTLVISGCQSAGSGSDISDGDNSPDTDTKSTEKNISNFVFRKDENDSLSGHASGTIDEEEGTISVILPQSADEQLAPTITISNLAAVSPASLAEADFSSGPVTYTVTAEDGTTKNYSIQVTYTTENIAPVARITAETTTLLFPRDLETSIQLYGSYSDPNGDASTLAWTLESRPDGSSAALSTTTGWNPTITPDTSGDYVVQLIANDSTADSLPISVTISAVSLSAPVITTPQDEATVDNPLTVTWEPYSAAALGTTWCYVLEISPDSGGSGYYSIPNTITSFSLADISEFITLPFTDTITALQPGETYEISLRIVDKDYSDIAGIMDGDFLIEASISVNILPEKKILSFDFTTLDNILFADFSGIIDESAKTITVTLPETSGTVLTPALILSEGAEYSPPGETDFTNPVTYTVTAQDDSTQDYVVTVNFTTENMAPIANISEINEIQLVGNEFTLEGEVSDANGGDLECTWSIISKPSGSTIALDTPESSIQIVPDVPGDYEIQLIATDDLSADSQPVSVKFSAFDNLVITSPEQEEVVQNPLTITWNPIYPSNGVTTEWSYILEVYTDSGFAVYLLPNTTTSFNLSSPSEAFDYGPIIEGEPSITSISSDGEIYLSMAALDYSEPYNIFNAEFVAGDEVEFAFEGTWEEDIYEVDDSTADTENVFHLGQSQNHTFHVEGDEDYVILDLVAGETVIIETSYFSYKTNTRLYLYNSLNELVSYNNSGGDGSYSRIIYNCTATGRYYIKVEESYNNDIGDYQLNVTGF